MELPHFADEEDEDCEIQSKATFCSIFSDLVTRIYYRLTYSEVNYECTYEDCSQCPICPWDFRDSNTSIELSPSLFVRASATSGECLNYRGGPSQVTLRSGSLDSLQVALALTNKDGGSSIEAYESRKSHGKIADCEHDF